MFVPSCLVAGLKKSPLEIHPGFQENQEKKETYMSKNLTRKGLALGAIVALGSTFFSGAAAHAAGLADTSYVSLAPTSGTQYNTQQGQVLDLSGAFANSVASGGSLKFLVTDPDKVIKADVDINDASTADATVAAYAGGTTTTFTITSGVATLTGTTPSGLSVGDLVTIGGAAGGAMGDINGTHFLTAVSGNTISFATTGTAQTALPAALTVAFTATNTGTGNATQAQIAAAPLGSRSVLGATASIGARASDGSFVVNTTDTAAAGVDNVLRLVSTAAPDTSATATVTAWIDNNGNGVIDSTEYVSPTRTVKFLKNSEITWTAALTAPKVGDTTLSADVTASPDINISEFNAGDVTVDFTKAGSPIAAGATGVTASYNSTDKVLRATSGTVTALTSGTFGAQVKFGGSARGDVSYQTIGSASVDVSSVSTPAITKGTSWNGTYAKTGTTALTVSSTVKYWKTYNATLASRVEAAAAAGIPALVTITNTALVSGSSVVAGGKTLTSTGTSISFATSTNADGKVVFPLTATGAKTDAISITVRLDDQNVATDDGSAAGSTQGYKTSSALSVTWADAAATNLIETGTIGYANSTAVRSVAKGGTITLNYDLRDQFGASVVDARQILVSLTGATSNAGATYTNAVALSGGKAAVAINDATTATSGSYTVHAVVQNKDTSGNWTNSGITKDVLVYVGTKAPTAVTATAGATTAAVTGGTFATNDLRLDNNAAGFADYLLTNGTTVSGVVSAADGSPVPGALVTIAGAGAQLVAANANDANVTATMGVGTVSVYTDATGAYSVTVYSRTSGDVTYTATVGAATASAKVTYTGITTLDDKGSVTVTAVALSQVSRTVTVTVLVKDSLGNPVKTTGLVKVALTGVGSLSASTVDTDANGVGTVRLVVGSNDVGDAVVTASYAQSDATKSVAGSTTINFGTTDSNIDIVNNRVTAVSSFTAGKTVAFYVDGIKKWSKTSASDADVVLNYNLKKGTHTVTVKISGGFITTEKFIVK
jgi:trimeric autotransporter adhesin